MPADPVAVDAAARDATALVADVEFAARNAVACIDANEFGLALDLMSTASRRIDDVLPILRTLYGCEARR